MSTKIPMKKRSKGQVKYKFQPEMVFTVYDMVKEGQTREAIAARLGIPFEVYKRWIGKNEAIAMAIKCGRVRQTHKDEEQTALDDYIVGRLPPDLKSYWKDLIVSAKRKEPVPADIVRLEVQQRQILFLTAWMKFRFNMGKACRLTGITRDTVFRWMTSPRFKRAMEELKEAKKDFFEDALLSCVARGDTMAVVFANKTLNRDRGYGEKKEVEVSGNISHSHEHKMLIDISELNLPIEVQAAIAEAMEKRRRYLELKDTTSEVIDAEFVKAEVNKFEEETDAIE